MTKEAIKFKTVTEIEIPIELVDNNVETFATIVKEMTEFYAKKNHDYGNSFDKSIDEWGDVAYFIRVTDKFNRAKNLSKNEAQVKYEKLEDTLKDIIGYTLLYLNYLSQKEAFICEKEN